MPQPLGYLPKRGEFPALEVDARGPEGPLLAVLVLPLGEVQCPEGPREVSLWAVAAASFLAENGCESWLQVSGAWHCRWLA